MSRFSILKNKTGYNYLLNSGFEAWIGSIPTSWQVSGSPTLTQGRSLLVGGVSSLSLVSSVLTDVGVYQDVSGLTSGQQISISVYAYRGTAPYAKLKVSAPDGSGAVSVTSTTAGAWIRISTPYTVPAGGIVRVSLLAASSVNGTGQSVVFDNAQLELGGLSPYFDGDSYGCSWEGAPHNSRGYRTSAAIGGDPVDLSSLGGKVQAMTGLGSPPRDPLTQEDAAGNIDILDYINRPRSIGLAMVLPAADMPGLHAVRKAYIDLLMPRKGEGARVLRYQPSATQYLDLPVQYEGGLEGSLGGLGGSIEKAGIRLTSYKSLPYEADPVLAGQGTVDNTFNPYSILHLDNNGLWSGGSSNLPAYGNPPTNTQPPTAYGMAAHPDGSIWMVTRVFNPDTVTPSTLRVQYQVWSNTGTSGAWVKRFLFGIDTADTAFTSFTISPSGVFWVGTDAAWTQIEGNSTKYAQPTPGKLRYSPDPTGTPTGWTQVGLLSGAVQLLPNYITFGEDGTVYVAHDGVTTAGVTTNDLAKGTYGSTGAITWAPVITGAPTFTGGSINVLATDGTYLYVGGAYTTYNGVAGYKGVIKVNLQTGAVTNMSNGAAGNAHTLTVDSRRGYIFAGALQTDSGDPNYNRDNLQVWRGSGWETLHTTDTLYDASIFVTKYDKYNDVVWIGGAFSKINYAPVANTDPITYNYPAFVGIRGAEVIKPDITLPVPTLSGSDWQNAPKAIAAQYGHVYLSYSNPSGATLKNHAVITCSVSRGTADTYPILTIEGSGLINTITNTTTGAVLRFNYTMQVGERLVIDLRPDRYRIISSLKGPVPYALHPSTNLTAFTLQPGTNSLAVNFTGASATTRLSVVYHPTYWGLDG